MRKEFKPNSWLFPMPVLIIGTYDKDDKLYREFFEKDVLIDENVVEKRKKEEKDYWSHIFRPDKIDARRIDNIRYKTRKCYDWGKKMPK